MQDVKQQLNEELANVEWNTLIPHAKRDAIIVVDETLDLVEVGVAIARDDSVSVQSWISQQLIHKPSTHELATWNTEPGKRFTTLIVQPFVIVQETENSVN